MTGSGRGLGKEIALQLAKEGAKLVCVDINADGVRETVETINGGRTGDDVVAEYYTTNVAEPSQVNELAKTVEEKWGRVDVLINNAGIVASAPLMAATDDQIKRMVDVNLMAHFWVSRFTRRIFIRVNNMKSVRGECKKNKKNPPLYAIYRIISDPLTGKKIRLLPNVYHSPRTTNANRFHVNFRPVVKKKSFLYSS